MVTHESMSANDDQVDLSPSDDTLALDAQALALLSGKLNEQQTSEPKVEEPAKDDALPSPQDAELSRRIAEMVSMEAKMLEEKRALREISDRNERELAELRARLEAKDAKLKEDPLTVLAEMGWDLESLVKAHMTQSTPEAVRQTRLERELAELKAERKREQEASEAAKKAAEASAAERQFKTDIIPRQLKLIATEIPTITAWFGEDGVVDVVYNLMGQEYQRTNGSYLEPQKAARMLEAQALERVKRLPGALVTQPQTQSSSKPIVAPSATLTNQQTQHNSQTNVVDPTDTAALDRLALETLQAMRQKA